MLVGLNMVLDMDKAKLHKQMTTPIKASGLEALNMAKESK